MSSSSSKSSSAPTEKVMKSGESATKLQCDLCKLSYSTEKELTEHLLSLMHHTKMEDKEKNPIHTCVLCKKEFPCMTDYRAHIGTNEHKKKLNKLRGSESDLHENSKKDKRQENEQQSKKWPENSFRSSKWGHKERDGSTQRFHWPQRDNDKIPYNGIVQRYPNKSFQKAWNMIRWGHGIHYNNQNNSTFGYSNYRDPYSGNQSYESDCHSPWLNSGWGAGSANFGMTQYRNPNGYSNNNWEYDFSEDAFDFNCDEQWLQEREKLLSDMNEDYFSRPYNNKNYRKTHFHRQNNSSYTQTSKHNQQNSKQLESSHKDRKRHREEDVPVSVPKTSKALDTNASPSQIPNEISLNSSKNTTNQLDSKNMARDCHQVNVQMTSDSEFSQKSSLDNKTSDNLLEKAERLCKELRTKRESSYALKSGLLKARNHNSLTDKINSIAEKQKSYFKGHIKDSDNSILNAKQSHRSFKSPPVKNSNPQSSTQAFHKTLVVSRKSVEKINTNSTARQPKLADSTPRRLGGSIFGEKDQQNPKRNAEYKRAVSREEDKDSDNQTSLQEVDEIIDLHSGTQQHLSKDSLMKMVNSPKSRTERLRLARMHQTRSDSRSTLSTNTRTNINLEGLYDTEITQDIHLDLGQGFQAPVIKLEDLSENIRNQIMNLIGEESAVSSAAHSTTDDFPCVENDQKISESKDTLSGTNSHDLDSINSDMNMESAVDTRCTKDGSPVKQRSVLGKNEMFRSKSLYISSNVGDKVRQKRKFNREKFSDLSQERFGENVLTRETTIVNKNSSTQNNDENTYTSLSLNAKNISSSKDDSTQNSLPASNPHSVPVQVPGRSSSALAVFELPPSQSLSDRLHVSSLSQDTNQMVDPTRHLEADSTSQLQEEECSHVHNSHSTDDRKQLNDESSLLSSSFTHDDSSSQTMSELLLLSEREEEVKQEMVNLDLRLTRLHRLLEQAVHQINRCTEQRNQLHDEEKNLTSQRMSLLRGVKFKNGSKTSLADDPNICSDASHEGLRKMTTPSNQVKKSSSVNQRRSNSTEETVSCSEGGSQLSLTKSEWLAKFSAFLPSTSATNNASSHPTTCELQAESSCLSVPVLSLVNLHKGTEKPNERTVHPVVEDGGENGLRSLADPQKVMTKFASKNTLPKSPTSSSASLVSSSQVGEPASTSGVDCTSSIMYVGSLNSNDILKGSMTSSTLTSFLERIDSGKGSSSTVSTAGCEHESMQLDHSKEINKAISPTPKTQGYLRSLSNTKNEDSDISSVASLASGSSLGEKISCYCSQTPGASSNAREQHALSTILSGPSDVNENKVAEDLDSGNESASVTAKKIALYGNLSKEAVKSAEALHLVERNSEGLADKVIEVKKKKRKTKHERNIEVDLRRRRIMLSSSSENEDAVIEPKQAGNLSALNLKTRRALNSTSEDSSSDVVEIQPPKFRQSSELVEDINNSSPEIIECDSAADFGMVNSASLNAQSNKLTEMKKSFVNSFGFVSKYKESKSHTESSMETADMINDTFQSLKTQFNKSILMPSDSDQEEVVDLCTDSDNNKDKRLDKNYGDRHGHTQFVKGTSPFMAETAGIETAGIKKSQLPSNLGSICYLKVIKEKLYVGYLQFGFQVFNMSMEHHKENCVCLVNFRCMEALEINNQVTVLAGQGCNICSIQFEDDSCTTADLGTKVTCIHVIQNKVHVGLDTGEICVLNKKLKTLNRYICADRPIYSMTSGQEGSTRLLCVSVLDSTITVMDSERCLPLRILVGHTKTAFSLQVHDRFVYSGSGDSTVMVHNIHTGTVENIFKDNKGMVHCVHISDGFLFTGGMDRLVRCYDTTTHKLVQVYYGANMGTIKSIYVHGSMLITGNSSGAVDMVTIDLKAKNICSEKGCLLNFGLKSHLSWHLQNDH